MSSRRIHEMGRITINTSESPQGYPT
ncbi:hypothetical protein CSPAE12_05068 [Colletotrichum incanum]|nr:hypothetical protein CSPAE12_05068 [Colletotrichum incanum]